jgi:hypothetical protein
MLLLQCVDRACAVRTGVAYASRRRVQPSILCHSYLRELPVPRCRPDPALMYRRCARKAPAQCAHSWSGSEAARGADLAASFARLVHEPGSAGSTAWKGRAERVCTVLSQWLCLGCMVQQHGPLDGAGHALLTGNFRSIQTSGLELANGALEESYLCCMVPVYLSTTTATANYSKWKIEVPQIGKS